MIAKAVVEGMFKNRKARTLVVVTSFGAVAVIFLAAWSCTSPRPPSDYKSERVGVECEVPAALERPNGSELRLSTKRLDANRLRVRIENVSNRTVYLPYSPEEQETTFVSYLTEKRNKRGDFERQSAEADFAPGLHGLERESEIQFDFFEVEQGEYRLMVRYLVDSRLVDLLNRPDCLAKIKNWAPQTELAYGRATSPALTIAKDIGTSIR